MKIASPGNPSFCGTRDDDNAFAGSRHRLPAITTISAAIVAISLLSACGHSGSDAQGDTSVASNPTIAKSLHGARMAGPNGSGDPLPETLETLTTQAMLATPTLQATRGAPTDLLVSDTVPKDPLTLDFVTQATTKPAPAPTASLATINSVDTIVDDMRLMNDVELAGVPSKNGWARGPGHVVMGNDPRGTNTPSWWRVNNQYYKSGAYWNAILPWFVVFDGVGNDASNTRVQVRNMKLYIKSKSSGNWKLLESSVGVSGEHYPKTLTGTNTSPPNTRTESDGSTSILPPSGNLVFHGWSKGFSQIDGSDVGAVFLTLQARLVKDKEAGPDDRNRAKYLIHVGGDYYPSTSTRASDLAPAYYFPGIGLSRAKLVNDNWQAFNFSTIDVGVEDPGGATLTEAQLRANPPPLD